MGKYLKEPFLVRFVKWFKNLWIVQTLVWAVQYLLGWSWIFEKIIFPIMKKVFIIYKMLVKWYSWLWSKVVYNGAGKFKRGLAATMIVATSLCLIFTPAMLYVTGHLILFVTTHTNETIYLTSANEIGEDLHTVRGCENLPCEIGNSVYYYVDSQPFTTAWAIVQNRDWFYPDIVASVVAPGLNRCQVESYGIRFKFLMKKGNIYPYMLNAVCMPMGGSGG